MCACSTTNASERTAKRASAWRAGALRLRPPDRASRAGGRKRTERGFGYMARQRSKRGAFGIRNHRCVSSPPAHKRRRASGRGAKARQHRDAHVGVPGAPRGFTEARLFARGRRTGAGRGTDECPGLRRRLVSRRATRIRVRRQRSLARLATPDRRYGPQSASARRAFPLPLCDKRLTAAAPLLQAAERRRPALCRRRRSRAKHRASRGPRP